MGNKFWIFKEGEPVLTDGILSRLENHPEYKSLDIQEFRKAIKEHEKTEGHNI